MVTSSDAIHDVLVVGGGVIGLTSALELAARGLSVGVADQGAIGREASWAGAGMIPPGHPGDHAQALHPLAAKSASLWGELSQQLLESTRIDNGYARCGSVLVPTMANESCEELVAEWSAVGVPVERLDRSSLEHCEPALSEDFTEAAFLPTQAQVRNPRHLKALQVACGLAGVKFYEGERIVSWEREGEHLVAARTVGNRLQAGQFLVTAGAWSQELLPQLSRTNVIEPVRGQIVLLRQQVSALRRIVECGPRYLVPRADGRVLIGATEERVGFVKANTANAVEDLIQLAVTLVPELASATFETAWSGLRPCASRGRPFIGPLPGVTNGYVAAGHFRAGLSMSPATAELIADLMTDRAPQLDPAPFAVTED